MEDPLFLYSALNTTSLPTALPLNVMINNSTVTDLMTNATFKPFNVFEGCEEMVAGILFDLTVQTFNVILGLPANILVLVILLRSRKEPSSSDIFLGCLAFMDAYFGIMVPFSYLNFYYWHSKDVWSALKFSYGVKDASGPLFLSCICLDRFVAVLFPLAYGQLKDTKYRVALSAVVLGLTFTYASAKTVGGLPNFEKVLTGTILATFAWMVLCNGAILVALKSSRGSGKDNMHPMKKKAFKMVMSVLSIIVFNYLPPVALFPFEDHYPPDTFRCLVQPVGYAFINISSSIQPIIYLSRLEKIPFLPDAWTKWCCSSNLKVKEVKVETISPA
ncbi:G-protein coupled receptor 183-like [Coregonus clupeaformis]|uniref:G-protein coupled receptor 183-like n=1 Tax=Coregonus clupeaformis TaxID=59861 RepID=UPI001BE015A0|nr:G-protein coupled receptor 183-like [Coregonus clupeaformis]